MQEMIRHKTKIFEKRQISYQKSDKSWPKILMIGEERKLISNTRITKWLTELKTVSFSNVKYFMQLNS